MVAGLYLCKVKAARQCCNAGKSHTMNNVLFSDNTTSNTETRASNIAKLNAAGFVPGGLPCRSGDLSLVEKATKCQLVFGTRSNISGKGGNKYFSLSKDFTTKEEAESFAKSLNLIAQ